MDLFSAGSALVESSRDCVFLLVPLDANRDIRWPSADSCWRSSAVRFFGHAFRLRRNIRSMSTASNSMAMIATMMAGVPTSRKARPACGFVNQQHAHLRRRWRRLQYRRGRVARRQWRPCSYDRGRELIPFVQLIQCSLLPSESDFAPRGTRYIFSPLRRLMIRLFPTAFHTVPISVTSTVSTHLGATAVVIVAVNFIPGFSSRTLTSLPSTVNLLPSGISNCLTAPSVNFTTRSFLRRTQLSILDPGLNVLGPDARADKMQSSMAARIRTACR